MTSRGKTALGREDDPLASIKKDEMNKDAK
jgi:hypothetical protein